MADGSFLQEPIWSSSSSSSPCHLPYINSAFHIQIQEPFLRVEFLTELVGAHLPPPLLHMLLLCPGNFSSLLSLCLLGWVLCCSLRLGPSSSSSPSPLSQPSCLAASEPGLASPPAGVEVVPGEVLRRKKGWGFGWDFFFVLRGIRGTFV